MIGFRISAIFILFILMGCASSLSVLGCEENPRLPLAPDTSANLVQDGGFERPEVSAFEYDSYEGAQPLGAWTIDAGAVDLLSGRVWGPADGGQSLDMDGSCGAGVIHQDLATEPGTSYELRFALSGNPNGPPVVKQLEVTWGRSVVDTVRFDTTHGTKRDPGWVAYDYTVVAPSGTTRLTFRSLSPGCYGALLDAVSVRRTPSI